MKEIKMNIDNYNVVISYDDRDDIYELWIDDNLCIQLEKKQINVFTTFINNCIEFISKLKSIADENNKI